MPVHSERQDARPLGVDLSPSSPSTYATQAARLVVAVVMLVAVACSTGSTPAAANHTSATSASDTSPDAATPGDTTPAGLAIGDVAGPMPAPGTCTLRHEGDLVLPDPACTPGTVNSAVTPDTIKTTICKSGWTATVRPPVAQTNKMKALSAKSYNVAPVAVGEYDHLVSLQLGGAPSDPRNLWFEPGPIPNPKDAVETRLNQGVCSGLITLTSAQVAIATDWTTALDSTGLTPVGSKTCLRSQPTRCATSASRTE